MSDTATAPASAAPRVALRPGLVLHLVLNGPNPVGRAAFDRMTAGGPDAAEAGREWRHIVDTYQPDPALLAELRARGLVGE